MARHDDLERHATAETRSPDGGVPPATSDARGPAVDPAARPSDPVGIGASATRAARTDGVPGGGLLRNGGAILFRDVVALLGSRVAARFAVLQLVGTGEFVLLAPGALTDAVPIGPGHAARPEGVD